MTAKGAIAFTENLADKGSRFGMAVSSWVARKKEEARKTEKGQKFLKLF